MTSRIATAAVGLPLLFIFVWVGSPWLSILVASAAAVATSELCEMFHGASGRPIVVAAALWAAVMVVGGHLVADGYSVLSTLLPILAGGAVALAVFVLMSRRHFPSLSYWGTTAGFALYTGGLLLHAPLLRGLDHGREWVLFVLIVTFAVDSLAFLVGRALGRWPLVPTISPAKTWEGAVGGLVAGVGAAVGFIYAFDLDASLGQALVLGAVAGITAQIGDLLASRLKRAAEVKDSGWMVPGHGGALDRLDSLMLNVGVLYYLVWLWVQ